jgi:hypothetical protein
VHTQFFVDEPGPLDALLARSDAVRRRRHTRHDLTWVIEDQDGFRVFTLAREVPAD